MDKWLLNNVITVLAVCCYHTAFSRVTLRVLEDSKFFGTFSSLRLVGFNSFSLFSIFFLLLFVGIYTSQLQ